MHVGHIWHMQHFFIMQQVNCTGIYYLGKHQIPSPRDELTEQELCLPQSGASGTAEYCYLSEWCVLSGCILCIFLCRKHVLSEHTLHGKSLKKCLLAGPTCTGTYGGAKPPPSRHIYSGCWRAVCQPSRLCSPLYFIQQRQYDPLAALNSPAGAQHLCTPEIFNNWVNST